MTRIAEFSDPVPTRASRKAVEDFAAKVASDTKWKAGEDGIPKLLHAIGGQAVHRDRVGREDGWIPPGMTVFGRGRFEIEISALASDERNALTIAIGIGHYLLHYPLAAEKNPHAPMQAPRWTSEGDPENVRRACFEAC